MSVTNTKSLVSNRKGLEAPLSINMLGRSNASKQLGAVGFGEEQKAWQGTLTCAEQEAEQRSVRTAYCKVAVQQICVKRARLGLIKVPVRIPHLMVVEEDEKTAKIQFCFPACPLIPSSLRFGHYESEMKYLWDPARHKLTGLLSPTAELTDHNTLHRIGGGRATSVHTWGCGRLCQPAQQCTALCRCSVDALQLACAGKPMPQHVHMVTRNAVRALPCHRAPQGSDFMTSPHNNK